ncbi:MAG: hypothetical protein M3Z54_03130 [Gemmatimonadota bacterium]|nr:hypothetical protein [Gemmatimonadota bacterium]
MRVQRLQELLRDDIGVIALVAHRRQSRQAARDASPFAEQGIPLGVGPNPAGRAESSLADEERRGATAGAGVRGDPRELVGREAEELCGGPEGGHRSSGGSGDEQMATSLSSLCTAEFAFPFYGPLERPPGANGESQEQISGAARTAQAPISLLLLARNPDISARDISRFRNRSQKSLHTSILGNRPEAQPAT